MERNRLTEVRQGLCQVKYQLHLKGYHVVHSESILRLFRRSIKNFLQIIGAFKQSVSS